MKNFEFLTQAGLNYIHYNTRELYRYTSIYLVKDAKYLPLHLRSCRWKGFERSFKERLRNLVNRNSINSGLCDEDLHVAIMRIADWIKELRDDSVKHLEPEADQCDKLGTWLILKTLPDEEVMRKEVYEKIKYILNFVMKQREQYIFEQDWKDRY